LDQAEGANVSDDDDEDDEDDDDEDGMIAKGSGYGDGVDWGGLVYQFQAVLECYIRGESKD
jgi:hypothetical protein